MVLFVPNLGLRATTRIAPTYRQDGCRSRWLQWLYEAKKSYGLVILNYAVTSNHIHLLAVGGNERDIIPNSIKLIAGRDKSLIRERVVKGYFGKTVIMLQQLKVGII